MQVEEPINTILRRVYSGIKSNDSLINNMISEVPEVCRPFYQRESDDKMGIGCLAMTAIIGKTALMVDYAVMTEKEALADITALNTCDNCPLRTFQ